MYEKKDTLLIGDQTQWEIQLQVTPKTELLLKPLENPAAPGVEVIENWCVDTLSKRQDELTLKVHATLTSFDSGSFKVPGREFYLLHPDGQVDTLHVGDLSLEYTTLAVDTTDFVPMPLKAQMHYPVTFQEVAPWGGGGLLLAFLLFVVIRYFRRRAANRPLFGPAKPEDPAHVVALRELDKIRSKKLWQNHKEKEYYTEVTDTVRRYIERRYEVSAMELTTPEIIALLRNYPLPEQEFAELQTLLQDADLVKFAKYTPSEEENERAIPVAVRFVNATFLQTLEEDSSRE
ncbi:MAG: hypothetical protein IKV28_04670 [Bacteroidales bacterium]|nr:hypothetical protein [Bacteroidales bacterium]